jgi:ribosomal protein L17
MTARQTPGRHPDRLLRDALLISLNRKAEKGLKAKRLQMVADALVDAAIKGELTALREVFDRVDGRFTRGQAGDGKENPGELRIRWLTAADEPPQP